MINVDARLALKQIGLMEFTLPNLLTRSVAGTEVVQTYAHVNREYFDSAGRGEWPPLAASTLEFKRRTGLPLAPMVRSGRLRAALTDPFGQGANDVDLAMAGDRITWRLREDVSRFAVGAEEGAPERELFDDGTEADIQVSAVLDAFLTSRGRE